MDYRKYVITSFFLGIAIFVLLLANSQGLYFRLDLSRDRAFSVSDYSTEILKSLPDDISIRYYLSRRLSNRYPAVEEIQDLLYEYQRISEGVVSVEILDPDDDPDLAPEDLGISPRELQVVENNEQTFAYVYSGISISYRDKLEVIPLIIDSSRLEYELGSRIIRMIDQEPQRVSVLLAKPSTDNQQYATLLQYLGQYYDMDVLRPGDEIPQNNSALIILGVWGLSDADVFMIEQQIMNGKGIFIAAESAEVDLQQNLAPLPQTNNSLLNLLSAYGLGLKDAWVYDQSNLPIPMQQQQGRVMFNTYQSYPAWIRVLEEGSDSNHPLSSRFQGLDLFWASPLDVDEERPGLSVLFRSSPNSSAVPGYNSDPRSMASQMLQAQDTEGSYPLAVAYEGRLEAVYDRPPDSLEERGIRFDGMAKSTDSARLVVIGDSDFPGELFKTAGASYNILLIQSAFEYLTGDERLLQMRTRGSRNTRLGKIADPDRKSFIINLARILSVFIIPAALALYALLRYLGRRRRARIGYDRGAVEGFAKKSSVRTVAGKNGDGSEGNNNPGEGK